MIHLKIDGIPVSVPEGTTILDAARFADISIPTLCHHPKLKPYGGCRLCIVEIKGNPRLVSSCTTPVSEDMDVITTNSRIEKLRRTLLELLLSDHPNDCMVCEKAGDCSLQELAYFYGVSPSNPHLLKGDKGGFSGERRIYEKRDGNPFIERDMEKCILCGKCVRICDEVQGVGAIDISYRGFNAKVCPPFEKDLDCEFCGQCVSVCPTGALTGKMWGKKGRQKDIKEINTICAYCGCGCSITLHVRRNEVIRVSSREDTLNEGRLCAKGRFGYSFINSPERLTRPLIRIAPKDNPPLSPIKLRGDEGGVTKLRTPNSKIFREASWDEALSLISSRLQKIRSKFGPDSIGGLASARCTNEENYLFQKFMRCAIGTNNVDHCARYCHSATVAGLATVFGSGAMTNSIPEIENNDVIFVIGSNTTETLPIVGLRIKKAVQNGAKLIIADPRKINLVRFSSIRMQHKPGTDVALLNGIMHVILKEKLTDNHFINEWTEGFDAFKKSIEDFTPEKAEKITGVPKKDIIAAARLYGRAEKAAIYYTMGITQHSHGTQNVFSVANLALMTGNLGREGTGVNPLRGQNNVQGACDVGCLPNQYPGYQKVDLKAIKDKFEAAWGVQLSDKSGITATEMTLAAGEGKLKALYIMGENPVISDPDVNHTVKALKNLDFLVVQDIFMTETAELADVVLPAACFAEKEGTFTNTERRLQRVRKAVTPPGNAKEDSAIIIELSRHMGFEMNYNFIEEVFQEVGRLWPAVAGITYNRIKSSGLQWPCPTLNHPGTPYLFKGGFPRGKAAFTAVQYTASKELPDKEYPFILSTGRQLFHYHTGSMTRKVPELNKVAPGPYIEINPDDAKKFKIQNGSLLKVSSKRGSITLKALISGRPLKGMVFIPFHYKEAAANILTNPQLDPICKIPEFKVCAVRIELAAEEASRLKTTKQANL
ncbi:MAG: formate dehydrogenase subunit alpha [Nitrospira bacterium HGW-Nitrospira-1]|nr:MAG: formate dehydrogenase subunit alpha [Nitrospira bacterium HGW-Nitrospira-1]